jgi:hypothetical protein
MEAWKREARSIKAGEVPHKFVKARKKAEPVGDNELFGYWQTKDYDTPRVVDVSYVVNSRALFPRLHTGMLSYSTLRCFLLARST